MPLNTHRATPERALLLFAAFALLAALSAVKDKVVALKGTRSGAKGAQKKSRIVAKKSSKTTAGARANGKAAPSAKTTRKKSASTKKSAAPAGKKAPAKKASRKRR